MNSDKDTLWKKTKVGIDSSGDISVIPELLPKESKITCKITTLINSLTGIHKRRSPSEDYVKTRLFGLEYRINRLEARLRRLEVKHD